MNWTTIHTDSYSTTLAMPAGCGIVVRVEVFADGIETSVSVTFVPNVKIFDGRIVPIGGPQE